MAITKDGRAIPWGHADFGGVFNIENPAELKLKNGVTIVKFTIFCIFFVFLLPQIWK